MLARAAASSPAVKKSKPEKVSGRKLAVAVDKKPGSVAAVQWVLANVARQGDTVHLMHVVNNPRTPSTAVDATSSGMQWSPPPEMPQLTKEWTQRMEDAGRSLLMDAFVPLVQGAGLSYEVDIVTQRGATSAAGIGEVICGRAGELKAEMMFIASHGTGVLADFGSVAQFCAKHAPVPVMLLPPAVLTGAAPAASSSSRVDEEPASVRGGVMVVAIDDLAGLEQGATFSAKHLVDKGEELLAVSVQNSEGASETCEEGSSVCEDAAAEEVLQANVAGWVKKRVEPARVQTRALLNVSNTEVDTEHSIVGQQLVAATQDSAARCVVLADTNKNNFMREIMYGNITSYFLRHCRVPVCVLP